MFTEPSFSFSSSSESLNLLSEQTVNIEKGSAGSFMLINSSSFPPRLD